MEAFENFLTENKACSEAVEFAKKHEFDPVSVYESCERQDWLIWWAAKKGVDTKTIVLVAIELAETVADTGPAEARSAIEAARRCMEGPSEENRAEARAEARAAAEAAAAAARAMARAAAEAEAAAAAAAAEAAARAAEAAAAMARARAVAAEAAAAARAARAMAMARGDILLSQREIIDARLREFLIPC